MVRRWCGGGNSQPLPASISPTQHRPLPSNTKQSQQSASTNQCQPAPNNFKHFEFLQPTFNNPNQDQVTPSKSSQPQPYPANASHSQATPIRFKLPRGRPGALGFSSSGKWLRDCVFDMFVYQILCHIVFSMVSLGFLELPGAALAALGFRPPRIVQR